MCVSTVYSVLPRVLCKNITGILLGWDSNPRPLQFQSGSNLTRVIYACDFFSQDSGKTEYTVLTHFGVWVKTKINNRTELIVAHLVMVLFQPLVEKTGNMG